MHESATGSLLTGFSERQAAVKDDLRTYAQVEYLVDPARCDLHEARALVKSLQELGVPLDTPLETKLAGALREVGAQAGIIRILDILSFLSLGTLILQFHEELMAYPDLTVRSKAALEIVRFGKSTAWVAHLLLHGDARVQANAVEALWQSSDQNLRPVLLIAGRSPHNRVAANALLGLYNHGSLDSIPLMLRMAADFDAARRASGLWAIGETRDPRFLPYLAGQFLTAEGKEKQCVVRALSRIRNSVRAAKASDPVRLTVLDAQIRADGSRRITAALWSRGEDLSSLQATSFAMWEAEELITDYSTRCIASPPLLILGFAAPRFLSTANLYGQAVGEALNGLAELKRDDDPLRLERYRLAGPSSDPGPRDAAARDAAEAIEKLVDSTARLSGPRHIFVFFDPADTSERFLAHLAKSVRSQAVTLHGFAPDDENDYSKLRDVCIANPGGTFQSGPLERLPQLLAETYLGLFHRYEILYRTESARTETATCQLRVRTPSGSGDATVQLAC